MCPPWVLSRLVLEGDFMKLSSVCAIAVLLCIGFAGQAFAADELFPDKNLEAIVRQYVFEKRNKPDPLVEADVVNISGIKWEKSLKLAGKIANLQGLEKCKSLASIELPNQ